MIIYQIILWQEIGMQSCTPTGLLATDYNRIIRENKRMQKWKKRTFSYE